LPQIELTSLEFKRLEGFGTKRLLGTRDVFCVRCVS